MDPIEIARRHIEDYAETYRHFGDEPAVPPGSLIWVVGELLKMVEPQPIRRGDVVQLWPTSPNSAVTVVLVTEVTEHNILFHPNGGWPKAMVTRIGRARYYPDGTPVED